MNDKHCLNCDNEITATQKFCSHCGQTTHVHRFTLTHFFHEVFHAFTHTDKGIFFLIKELFLRPGIVAKEYIAGKRKKYFNPFTFFLILAAFFVFSSSLSGTIKKEKQDMPERITKIDNDEKREEAIAIYERALKTQQFFIKHGNIVAMIAVPFFACYFWLIFYKRKYNYSEHLVANLMFVSFANLAFSLFVFPLQILLKTTPFASMVYFLGFLLQLVYFVVAYKGLMELKGFWPVTKIVVATIISLILWAVFSQLASAIYVYQNQNFMDYFRYLGGR